MTTPQDISPSPKQQKELPLGIVGFDPGTTSAIAVISLDRGLLLLGSWRDVPPQELARKVMECSRVVVVASDVSPPPRALRRFSAAFGAVLFVPELSLMVEEKKNLTSGFHPQDAHQRDALAAALHAFDNYSRLISKARKLDAENYEVIFRDVVRKNAPNFFLAVNKPIEEEPEAGESEPKYRMPIELKVKQYKLLVKKLRAEMQNLALRIDDLTLDNEVLKSNLRLKLAPVRGQWKLMREARKAKGIENRLKAVESAYRELKSAIRRFAGEDIVIMTPALKGDVIFVPVFDRNASLLCKAKLVITNRALAENPNGSVVTVSSVGGASFEDMAFIPLRNFPKISSEWLSRMVDDYRARKKEDEWKEQ